LRPMRAPDSSSPEPAAAPAAAMPNLEEIRRMLYRDLMTQIRADFERGG
jgi:hypothetical protein